MPTGSKLRKNVRLSVYPSTPRDAENAFVFTAHFVEMLPDHPEAMKSDLLQSLVSCSQPPRLSPSNKGLGLMISDLRKATH